MSAYIVSDAHIDILISYAVKKRVSFYFGKGRTDITRDNASEVGQILLDENFRSVNERYRSDDKAAKYKFDHRAPVASELTVLKLIHCLDYQSCETEDWKSTEAWAVLDNLKDATIRSLPGYDAAPWGV